MHLVGGSKKPQHVIQRMNQRKHDPAPQVGPGAVAFAIIFPRMPIGQVLSPFGPRAEHLAEPTLAQLASQAFQQRVEAELAADHRGQLLLQHKLGQFLAMLERMGQGLFDKQVAAGPGRRQRDFQMPGRRVGYDRDLRPLCQRLVKIAGRRPGADLGIGNRGLVRAIEYELGTAQRSQVLEMPSADGAEPGDQNRFGHAAA